jgi:hypothetical protein
MQEYLGLTVVHAVPRKYSAEVCGRHEDGSRKFINEAGQDGYEIMYNVGGSARADWSWSPADVFEENHVAVADGEGATLKAIAALAILEAMQGDTPPAPANEQPSNAELGRVTEEHIRGTARLCHNVAREFLAYEGLLHRPAFDACPLSFQHEIMNRVSDIVHERPYRVDMSNKVEALKDRFYRVIIQSILAP